MSNGKGDTPRPFSVDQQTFANNWDKAFNNTEKSVSQPSSPLSLENIQTELDNIRQKIMGDRDVHGEGD